MMRWLMGMVLLSMLAASGASAQSLFIDGTAFAAIERRGHVEVDAPDVDTGATDLNGVVGGGGVTVGTWLTPHVTVRLEVGLPGSVEDSHEFNNVIPLSVLQSLTFIERSEASEQLRTVAALLGYHTERRHRIQLGYIGGAAFVFARQHVKYESVYPVLPPLPLPLPVPLTTQLTTQLTVPRRTFESTMTSYGVTAETGLDVDVSLSRRFSIVPQVRVIGFGNGISIRPGVALRASW